MTWTPIGATARDALLRVGELERETARLTQALRDERARSLTYQRRAELLEHQQRTFARMAAWGGVRRPTDRDA